MSSLAVSLLLLFVAAIAVVVFYNLRQAAPPRWFESLRRLLPESLGGEPRDEPGADGPAHASPASTRPGDRGEPRLSALAPQRFGERTEPGERAFDPGDALGGERIATQDAAAMPAGAEDPAEDPRARARHDTHFDGSHAEVRRDEAGSAVRRTAEVAGAPGAAGASAAAAGPAAGSPHAVRGARAGAGAGSTAAPGAAIGAGAASASNAASPVAQGSRTAQAGGMRAAGAAGAASERAGSTASEHAGGAAAAATRAGAAPLAGASPAPQGAAGSLLSEVCDCIVELAFGTPCSGERLIGIAQRFRRAGSKPVAIEALVTEGAAWEPPQAGRVYVRARAGILLANRHGPLNAMEFSEFAGRVQELADALAAAGPVPAMGAVLARARDFDATCAQLDAQIGVNVDASEAIEPAQLAAMAPAFAIIERGSHRYVRPGPQGEALFSVSLAEAPNRVTFLLDVPRSSPSLDAWAQMVECASACAQRLGARLADDSGRPLTQAALSNITRQLQQRYESLEALGLPAGSPLAMKVFS